ncbi:tail fiber protein [Citrobacter phage CF1 DK-2017]|uniref:Tail fiber protein n=1 Tax=Citrobacter phage CF1 DK-2017 TaxID=2267237 RepID=A0A1W6DXJ6_9CAUD|nr:tail fiber protein [Citrobacter phage CF1 DK-2017]ARK07609.1 tail fiber protein [Citrobacter phage CF1 DK-2017]
MALYRTGTAAMDAQGVITGTGTKWREPLSLIRTGATIVFLDQPVIKLAVISEIVSNTEMKAISTDGAVVPDGKYVILLNDSLTVDGMAQDVAETLRYYQSKETVIEEAIEFFKNFDLKTLQDLVNKVNADAQQVANDKAATEQLKNETQQIKDSAVSETQQIKDAAVNETNQIKADTDAIKTQTQQIKDSAVSEIGSIKNESVNARDAAKESQLAAEQSKIAADSAKAGAETARDEARQWAQQVNPENLLHKDQNLNDLANKDLAREALKVEAVNSVKGQNPGDYNSFRNPTWTYELRIANNGEWRVARNSDNSTSALSVGAGGTGAENIEGARKNFRVQGVFCITSETPGDFNSIKSPDGKLNMLVANNGVWGVQDDYGNIKPLHIERGGTGAQSIGQARSNFGIGETDIPVFRGISLTEKNSANSGILYLLNKNAEGVQISYSRVYNEIQGGIAKATIQVTREGGDTNYYQFDESGNALNYNSITIGRGIGNALGSNSIVIGDTDTGFRQNGDGILQAIADNQVMFAFTKSSNVAYRTIQSFTPEDARFAYVEGARRGGANCFIGGHVEGGAFTAWRDRAAGMLVELPSDDVAVNVVKVVRWGGDWAFGIDVARYGAGGCETHFNVRGAVYGFNDAGYASAVQWVNTSDIRLKANLKEIESAKEKVKSIKGYTYFKRNNLDEDEYSFYSEEAGVIAQDVQTVLPEAVYKISDSEYLGVSYGGVTALLVNAINEMIDDSDKQNETIQKQQDEINELKNEVAEMKKMIEEMQSMFIQIAK